MSNIILSKTNQNYTNEFDKEILTDLIKEGYSGTALLEEIKSRKIQLKQAIKAMLDNAHAAAEGKTESYSMSDAFED